MSFDAGVIPDWLNLALGTTMLVGLATAFSQAQWRALRAVPARLHLLGAATAFCLVLWMMSVDVGDTLRMHLLGMTGVTLVLGWCFAVQCGSVALLLTLPLAGESLAAYPAAWLLTVAIPATVSRLLVTRLARLRQQNLFVYTLGGGFAGAMLAVLAVAMATLALLWLAGERQLLATGLENWPMLALILFPEGFINGMLVTAICVYHPEVVKTFDDRRYIDGQ